MKNKILAVLLTMATLFCMTGMNAYAATTSVFDGYTITVLDKTTPAASMRGRTNDRNVMCFVSAADQEVGTISHSDYSAIIAKYRKVVMLEGGGSYGVPPVEGKSWEAWFADEFNAYRGLGAESREIAVATTVAETTEQYRQEVIRLTNIERENAGLAPLAVDEDAVAFAQIRAEEIVTKYSHTRPNGEPLRVNGGMVNENIGARETPEAQVNSWMASDGHRGNILNSDAYAIGVGVYQTESGAFYWIQIFMW
ncbi:CAP domain-containing protein [Ruminococcaceae bacterium OttesenSCG-928-L11]|nr:CAP domain-containing protein [Ruminococcaceae bacterium OttesenSCG-928-L11]